MYAIYTLASLFGALAVEINGPPSCGCRPPNSFPNCPPPNVGLAVVVFNTTLNATDFTIYGADFYKNVMKFSKTQVDEVRREAIEFFSTKFGIEHNDSDYVFMLYQTNPRANMRTIVLSGEKYLPTKGFETFDGGFMMMVINPNGTTLGGDFVGYHAVMGQTFTLGHLYIERVDEEGELKQPYIFKQKYAIPGAVVDVKPGSRITDGELEVYSEKWGTGTSLYVAKYDVNGMGIAHALLRNVFTF